MANPTGKGGFQKGDTRINRKGRPRTFDGNERSEVYAEVGLG